MCTAIIAQEILDALQARVSNGSVFSAFDITTDARDGTDERINHKDVKRIVTREFGAGQFPGYNKDVIQLDMMDNPNVIVYYPDGKSASDHPKALKQVAAPISIPVSPSPNPNPNPIPPKSRMGGKTKVGNKYVCKVTAEGRVNIPMSILMQISSQVSSPGGTYDILFHGKSLYRESNADGRLRIAKSELDGGDEFTISVDTVTNVITIE